MQIKFRASAIGKLMIEPRSKSETLSETTKTYLTEVYVQHKYGRKKDISNRYTIKGLQVEEDSITLYSRMQKNFFKKNDQRIENDFITGTPDLYMGESIQNADLVIDIKSSWDIFTFFNASQDSLNKAYYWQLQAYMALTGAKYARLVYCLVDTPFALIADEKRKLMWKMNAISEDDKDYQSACDEIERNMTYSDIPMSERFHEIGIERNDADIERIYNRVHQCREYIHYTFIKQMELA